MKTTKTLCLQVTSDAGSTIKPMLSYDYKCKHCGASNGLVKISGFGTPPSNVARLFFETSEVLENKCRGCGVVDLIRTELAETDLVKRI